MREYMRRRRAEIRERARDRGDIPHLDRYADSAVYFISDGAGHIKIGVTGNIQERLAAMQLANATELRIEAVIPGGGAELESELHDLFGLARARGEWFHFTSDIRNYIDALQFNKPREGSTYDHVQFRRLAGGRPR
jgi:hypothetical protein